MIECIVLMAAEMSGSRDVVGWSHRARELGFI
jgi:hypothetical protein